MMFCDGGGDGVENGFLNNDNTKRNYHIDVYSSVDKEYPSIGICFRGGGKGLQ